VTVSYTVYTDIDEDDVARAILSGDLQLELILQNCLRDEADVDRLVKCIEPLGGTAAAGELAAKFAAAMIQS
jgi:hypothetical protein